MYVQPGEVLGGAERQGVVHISRLRELGFDVLPVVGPSDAISRALEQEGIRGYIHLRDFFHPTFDRGHARIDAVIDRALSDMRSSVHYFRTQQNLARLIEKHPVDVIFASRSFAWSVATPVARRLGVPIVWRAGGCMTTKVEELALRWLSRIWPPSALVCNSEAVREGLAAQLECPSYIIQNGVDTRRFDPDRAAPKIREELGLGPGVPVVSIVARPRPLKNFELLAEVIRRTARRVPDVRLIIAGDSSSTPQLDRFDWRQHYEQLYARLGLAERTTFLGHRDDVETVYRSSDVAVLTSHSEGSPNAVLEAMAMERPVVANGVPGLKEIVQHGVQGYLAAPNDAEAFSVHLEELLLRPDIRARMGAAGRETILARYSDLAAARRLAEVLAEVLARSPRRRPTNGARDGPARGLDAK